MIIWVPWVLLFVPAYRDLPNVGQLSTVFGALFWMLVATRAAGGVGTLLCKTNSRFCRSISDLRFSVAEPAARCAVRRSPFGRRSVRLNFGSRECTESESVAITMNTEVQEMRLISTAIGGSVAASEAVARVAG